MEQQNEDKKGIWIPELNEWIQDDYCYSEAAADIVDGYCRMLREELGMTRDATEDDPDTEEGEIIYTDKACRLIDEEIRRWHLIGEKYFPDGDIDIHEHLTNYREL